MNPFLVILGIFAALILLVFFVLSIRIQFIIEYRDTVALTAKVMGVPIRLYPRKKKKRYVKSMSAKTAKKILERRAAEEEKKRQKAEEKRKAKAKKKKEAEERKKRENASPEAKRKAIEARRKKKAERATFSENLDLVKQLVSFFSTRFVRHLRIDATRIRIIVGSEEASKTAILYGVTVQTVAYILTLLDKVTNLHGIKKRDVYIDTDFLSEEIKVDLKIGFSLRLWHLLHLGGGGVIRLLKNRLGVRKRVMLANIASETAKLNTAQKS